MSMHTLNPADFVEQEPVEIYNYSQRGSRPIFRDYLYLFNIQTYDSSDFVRWLKAHFSFNSTFNVLKLRCSSSGFWETRLYAPRDDIVKLHWCLMSTSFAIGQSGVVSSSIDHSPYLQQAYKRFLDELDTLTPSEVAETFNGVSDPSDEKEELQQDGNGDENESKTAQQADEEEDRVDELPERDFSVAFVVEDDAADEHRATTSADEDDSKENPVSNQAPPVQPSPSVDDEKQARPVVAQLEQTIPRLHELAEQRERNRQSIELLQTVNDNVNRTHSQIKSHQDEIMRLIKTITAELKRTKIGGLSYDAYGSYRSKILAESNERFSEMTALKFSIDRAMQDMRLGLCGWTRENLVFVLQQALPDLIGCNGNYPGCLASWEKNDARIELEGISELVWEVMGVSDANDRQKLMAEVESLKSVRAKPNVLTFGKLKQGARESDVPSSASPSRTKNGDCIVCLSEACSHIFYPCGHMCACETCGMEVLQSSEDVRCPLCRAPVEDLVRVFK